MLLLIDFSTSAYTERSCAVRFLFWKARSSAGLSVLDLVRGLSKECMSRSLKTSVSSSGEDFVS